MLGDTPSDIFDLECHRWIVGLSDSLNQALLYRLVSLMNVSDPNKTLQKSFLSLFSKKRKTSRKQNKTLYIDDETDIIITK